MKLFALFFLLFLMAGFGQVMAQSQIVNPNSSAFLSKFDGTGMVYGDVNKDKVKGIPFYMDVLGTGYVLLDDGLKYSGFELQFDLVANAVYYKWENNLYKFARQVMEARISFYNGDDSLRILIRSGFPAVSSRNANALYLVQADGAKFQLVKYLHKNIVEIAAYGTSITQEYKAYEQLYLYDVQKGSMSPVSRKTSPSELLTPSAVKAWEQAGGKTKTEDDWKKLVLFLNAQ